MKNKYFILVFTFLCLLVVQSSYSQDWQDMGWDDETNNFVQDYVDQGGTVDYFNDAQDYAEAVNNDNDSGNDWEYGSYIDSDLVGTTIQKSDGTIYDYKYTEGWFPVNHSSDGTTIDIFDNLLDTHNYDNDTSTTDDDQYPPDDTADNNDTTTPDPTTPDPSTCKCVEKTWYFDNDRDGYHGDTQDSVDSPGSNWGLTTKGLDCDDDIWSADNTNCEAKKTWYLDNDTDGFHFQAKQAEISPGTKWKDTTRGIDCNDARYNVANDCSTANPCAEIKNILNYDTQGSTDKNLKSNINRLKDVVNAPVNTKEEGFEVSKRMNADETYRYEFDKVAPGSEFTVELSTSASYMGGFHSHPSTGVPIFSFQDLKHLLNLYTYAKAQYQQDVFEGLVAKDAEGNTNVYILKVDDIDALRDQVDAVWNHPDYAEYTDDKERRDAIHEKQGKIFDKSNGQIEKSFLEQFPTAGISLYKADASVSSFSKLTLNNGTVTPTPCN